MARNTLLGLFGGHRALAEDFRWGFPSNHGKNGPTGRCKLHLPRHAAAGPTGPRPGPWNAATSDGSVAAPFCLGLLGRALTRALGDDRSARPCNGTCTCATESSVR